MRRFILAFLLVNIFTFTYSQNGIVSCGSSIQTTGGSVSSSTGQIAYKNVISSANNINEGIQQPLQTATGIEEISEIVNINIFPNPTKDYFNLSIEGIEKNKYSYALFDIEGRLILNSSDVKSDLTTINTSELHSGQYELVVYKNNTKSKTLIVAKN